MRYMFFIILITISSLVASPTHKASKSKAVVASNIPDCNCGNTLGTNHDRQTIKDRCLPSSKGKVSGINISDMINWSIPNANPAAGKMYPKEDSIFQFTGFIRLTKLSDDDCDYHIEVGATPNGTNDRIIAEIPNTKEYCPLRDEYLKILGLTVNDVPFKGIRFPVKTVPKVTITGYAFLDTHHRSSRQPKKGHNHGSANVATLWELHPIISITKANP